MRITFQRSFERNQSVGVPLCLRLQTSIQRSFQRFRMDFAAGDATIDLCVCSKSRWQFRQRFLSPSFPESPFDCQLFPAQHITKRRRSVDCNQRVDHFPSPFSLVCQTFRDWMMAAILEGPMPLISRSLFGSFSMTSKTFFKHKTDVIQSVKIESKTKKRTDERERKRSHKTEAIDNLLGFRETDS